MVKYEQAFMFAYSLREKTHAHRNFTYDCLFLWKFSENSSSDDVPADIKQRRLAEVIATFNKHAVESNQKEVSKTHLVLIEGVKFLRNFRFNFLSQLSRKSKQELSGRTDTNKICIIPDVEVNSSLSNVNGTKVNLKPGDYVAVKIVQGFAHSLKGEPIAKTTLTEFNSVFNKK